MLLNFPSKRIHYGAFYCGRNNIYVSLGLDWTVLSPLRKSLRGIKVVM